MLHMGAKRGRRKTRLRGIGLWIGRDLDRALVAVGGTWTVETGTMEGGTAGTGAAPLTGIDATATAEQTAVVLTGTMATGTGETEEIAVVNRESEETGTALLVGDYARHVAGPRRGWAGAAPRAVCRMDALRRRAVPSGGAAAAVAVAVRHVPLLRRGPGRPQAAARALGIGEPNGLGRTT